jgi:hypothetical protein
LDGSKMTLNPEKTIIGFSERKMVGHIVSKNNITIDPNKLDRMSKIPFPTTTKTFQGF